MTPAEFDAARRRLGLSGVALARMLGVSDRHWRRLTADPSTENWREPSVTLTRLLRAYLEGYRPPDWPS